MLVHVHTHAHSHLHVYRSTLFTDEKQQSDIKTGAEDRLAKSCKSTWPTETNTYMSHSSKQCGNTSTVRFKRCPGWCAEKVG